MSRQLERVEIARMLLSKAAGDLKNAEHTLTLPDGECPLDTVCFHAQQCAEKSLKAFLAYQGIAYQRTHELGQLLHLCRKSPDLIKALEEIQELTPYATAFRYEESESVDRQEAQRAVSIARSAFEFIHKRLGVT